MNKRTAGLIQRYAQATHQEPGKLKRAWNLIPRPKRGKLRRIMEDALTGTGRWTWVVE